MSWQAMDAIDRIPYDACKPLEFRVLTKLANVAAQDGTRAFRSVSELARELKVSTRSIQRALKALEASRLIVRGDQRHVGHLRADRRPVVYDINMPKCLDWEHYHGLDSIELDGVTSLSTGDDENPVNIDEYGVTSLSTESHGVTHDTTSAVAHRELIERSIKSFRGNKTAAVTPLGPCGHALVTDRHCEFGCKPAEAVTA